MKIGPEAIFLKNTAPSFTHRNDWTLLVIVKNICFISQQVCHPRDYSFFWSSLLPSCHLRVPSTHFSDLLGFTEVMKDEAMMN